MEHLHTLHPQYGWLNNKAYGTVKHREAIAKYGATEYHRMSFRLLPEQLSLEL
jgi:ribonuclease HII